MFTLLPWISLLTANTCKKCSQPTITLSVLVINTVAVLLDICDWPGLNHESSFLFFTINNSLFALYKGLYICRQNMILFQMWNKCFAQPGGKAIPKIKQWNFNAISIDHGKGTHTYWSKSGIQPKTTLSFWSLHMLSSVLYWSMLVKIAHNTDT